MAKRRAAAAAGRSAREQDMRDQEVLRANHELTAYFKGQRTEREARAALKIIKAFVRDRERLDDKDRTPLPGVAGPAPDAAPKKSRGARPRIVKPRARPRRRSTREPSPAAPEPLADQPPTAMPEE